MVVAKTAIEGVERKERKSLRKSSPSAAINTIFGEPYTYRSNRENVGSPRSNVRKQKYRGKFRVEKPQEGKGRIGPDNFHGRGFRRN